MNAVQTDYNLKVFADGYVFVYETHNHTCNCEHNYYEARYQIVSMKLYKNVAIVQ